MPKGSHAERSAGSSEFVQTQLSASDSAYKTIKVIGEDGQEISTLEGKRFTRLGYARFLLEGYNLTPEGTAAILSQITRFPASQRLLENKIIALVTQHIQSADTTKYPSRDTIPTVHRLQTSSVNIRADSGDQLFRLPQPRTLGTRLANGETIVQPTLIHKSDTRRRSKRRVS